jgi:hypothetical protein
MNPSFYRKDVALSSAPSKSLDKTNIIIKIFTELGITPAPLFKWGLVLITPFFLLITFSYDRRIRFFRHMRHLERYDNSEDYRDLAIKWLQDIRFQQSYTTGWSGAFKLPIGAESNMNRVISLAQYQLTLPEIHNGFIHVLNKLAIKNIVIIGIDEMDKLASDEKAIRFINDLKSIFGVHNVFYLISVSESAMSSFERRGLPFRDAFDSAFDSIVYVDYLDFNDARKLIARRIIGMPLQFVALCYTIAGGLPRDILRTCRLLMDVKCSSEFCGLSEIGYQLIYTEVKNKWRASIVAIKKALITPTHNLILEIFYKLHLDGDAETWIETAIRINNIGINLIINEKEIEPFLKLKALCVEFGTYLYFCATICQFFQNSLTQNTFDDAWQKGHIDQLARARQAFSVNTIISRSLIDVFRKERGFEIPSFNMKVADNHIDNLYKPSCDQPTTPN